MPRFFGYPLPVIMFSVLVFQRRGQQFLRCQIIETGKIDAIEYSRILHFAAAKRLYAACLAEEMRDCLAAELVFGQTAIPGDHPHGIRTNDGFPETPFGAG